MTRPTKSSPRPEYDPEILQKIIDHKIPDDDVLKSFAYAREFYRYSLLRYSRKPKQRLTRYPLSLKSK